MWAKNLGSPIPSCSFLLRRLGNFQRLKPKASSPWPKKIHNHSYLSVSIDIYRYLSIHLSYKMRGYLI